MFKSKFFSILQSNLIDLIAHNVNPNEWTKEVRK
jgi:hypothetical protein